MLIGSFNIKTPLALAPMAGITDKPFRQICYRLGANWLASEMLTSIEALQHTNKTKYRANFDDEIGVRVIQIAGSHPKEMAKAAQYNVARGAEVIDINMGCPAKKVCHVLAGSALLKNEKLVAAILNEVVKAVDVPVTLKTRLGWDEKNQNIITIAKIAQDAGISALAIHGRTREQFYKGHASYDLIGEVKKSCSLPLWVNGDLDSPQKAFKIQQLTQADGVMIGRAAQGHPWIFRDLAYYFKHLRLPSPLSVFEHTRIIRHHLTLIHQFYGENLGVRIARKHINWYIKPLDVNHVFRLKLLKAQTTTEQNDLMAVLLNEQINTLDQWPCHYRNSNEQ